MKAITSVWLFTISQALVFSAHLSAQDLASAPGQPALSPSEPSTVQVIVQATSGQASAVPLAPNADPDNLLVAINRKGLDHGLSFELFKPAKKAAGPSYDEMAV